MVKEFWKNVAGYNNLYEVSNLGNIRNRLTKHQMSPRTDKWGYAHLKLSDGGKGKTRFVHRIVAITFIENPENKTEVNHIDGNKLNNRLDNLEWSTGIENELHALQNGLITPRKPVIGTHKKTNDCLWFESINDAARKTKECVSGISASVRGKQHGTQNYDWKLAL